MKKNKNCLKECQNPKKSNTKNRRLLKNL